MSWYRGIFYSLVAVALIQVFYYYPRVPDIVASHFDGRGTPNDWSSRNGFFGLYLAILLLLVAVFDFVPRWSGLRSRFGTRIPHADYWLAAQRIDQTKLFFRRQMFIMGSAHLLLSIFTIQLAIEANFSEQPNLHPSIGWALALYFIFLAGWLIHFFLHFRKP